MLTCKIQWIDPSSGKLTPDDNEAIGYAVCFCGDDDRFDSSVKLINRFFPICRDHLERMPREGWMFVSMREATPDVLDRLQQEIKTATDAIRAAWPDQAKEIIPTLRRHGGVTSVDQYFSFVRWGMFVGVERDGYIHT